MKKLFILTILLGCVIKPKDQMRDIKDLLKQIKPEVVIFTKP